MSCGGVDAQMRPVMLEMRPAPEDVLRMWLIDKKVGNVRNDGPDLLEPQPTGCAPAVVVVASDWQKAWKLVGRAP
jgi:hypothetical protein